MWCVPIATPSRLKAHCKKPYAQKSTLKALNPIRTIDTRLSLKVSRRTLRATNIILEFLYVLSGGGSLFK